MDARRSCGSEEQLDQGRQIKMKSKTSYVAAVSMAAISVALAAVPAVAQDAQAPTEFEDIVVTARKVAESAQSLPITVAAFSGAELTKKVVLNVQDLQTVTPGLTIGAAATAGAPIFAIRGTATELGIDGGVALYMNDVPVISSFTIANAFYDVSTVEVLKGPQGTQFGTNTTGGTISVRTNRPTDRFEGYVKGGYGNYNRRELEGMINLPVNDVLGFRFAGNYVKRDGYVKNPIAAGGAPKEFSSEDHYSARGTMSLNSGPVNSVLILDYFNRDEEPIAQIPVAFGPTPTGVNLTNLGAQTGTRKTIFVGADPSGVRKPFFGKAKLFGLEHLLEIELSDSLSLRNVVGYRHEDTDTSEESSGTTITQVHTTGSTKNDQWTDDLTLRYTGLDGRIRASLGGYFSQRDKSQGLNSAVVQGVYLTFFNAPLVTEIHTFERAKFKSKAVYFNSDFDITETLSVTGGFRYNWDRIKSAGSRASGNGVLATYGYNFYPTATIPCSANAFTGFVDFDLATCSGTRSASFRAPSWMFAVTNKFNSDVLAYAKISHGYLAGGLNFTIREVPAFKPEKTTMMEAGVKADWSVGGRPIRTNVAIYHGKTSDKQVFYNFNYDDGSAGFGVFNAAKLSVYGADFEMRFSPVDRLTLDASYNYIHSKFDKFLFPAVGGNGDGQTGTTLVPATDLSNSTPAQTPEHQFNVAASYEWPLDPSAGTVTSTISGYYTSKITQTNVFPPYNATFGQVYNTIDGYFTANASLNWENVMGSPISAQLWVRNLFDKNYIVYRGTQFQAFGYSTVIYGAPRTYGASATFRF
ncbi:TonB-dependent receptor [Sphingopyxis flava]|uniref:Iron complex outermembrane recepter protein n=1 Tax=Sphingopyxis flava TaxID=1507287 RepID=A0A1T5G4K2_9SPHN|nr:TonB-dependent receptor [Sphingopyxis flava]SKC03366.1 iron complex outermembrane recepter protein [Sphingopyxis flava]